MGVQASHLLCDVGIQIDDQVSPGEHVAPPIIWLQHLLPDTRLYPAIICIQTDILRLRRDILQEQRNALLFRQDRLLLMLDCDVSALMDELAITNASYTPLVDLANLSRARRRSLKRFQAPMETLPRGDS